MQLKSLIAVLSAVTYALASSDLCIQGCCDSKVELSSSHLKLIPITKDAKAETIDLKAAELKCCECPAAEEILSKQNLLRPKHGIPPDAIACAEGSCFPGWCECSQDAKKKPGQFQLRALCKVGECFPNECMCAQEVVQGLHDMILGSSDKDGSRSIAIYNSIAERLGLPKFTPGKNPDKNEL